MKKKSKSGVQRNLRKRFCDLKEKQKHRITEWLYIATYRYYCENSRMPGKSGKSDIVDMVYNVIESFDIWIPYGEVDRYYHSRFSKFEKRVMRDIANDRKYPDNALEPVKKKSLSETEPIYDFDEDTDDTFAYIAGYTSGGAPYGVTWEELSNSPELPF